MKRTVVIIAFLGALIVPVSLVGTVATAASSSPPKLPAMLLSIGQIPTTTTDPPTVSTGRPAGLIQAGDSKTNCIYVTDSTGLPAVEQTIGITYNCIETFNAGSAWSDWVSPWVTHNPSASSFYVWLRADPTGHQIIITQTLIPTSVSTDPNWLAECATGDFNTYATQLATNLVSTGFGYSVIRLGPEMNGDWEIDSLGATAASWQQWGQCFAQEVTAMRAVAGGDFLFDWNVNAGTDTKIPFADYYPGNAYVNIIGVDAYDESAGVVAIPAVGQPGRFAALAAEPGGIDAVDAFAAANGKPLSIPEWGVMSTQGDDPAYVTGMGSFVATHDVAYESYYDVGDANVYQLDPGQAPLSLAAYALQQRVSYVTTMLAEVADGITTPIALRYQRATREREKAIADKLGALLRAVEAQSEPASNVVPIERGADDSSRAKPYGPFRAQFQLRPRA